MADKKPKDEGRVNLPSKDPRAVLRALMKAKPETRKKDEKPEKG